MFGQILEDPQLLDAFRTNYQTLSPKSKEFSDLYLKKSRVRGFFDHHGDLVGGYIFNTEPPFRYWDYLPERSADSELFKNKGKTAEVTCAWMRKGQRGAFLRHRVYVQVMLDFYQSGADVMLAGTLVEKIRRMQQVVLRHNLWHGVDTQGGEYWIYYGYRRELLGNFAAAFVKETLSSLRRK